MSSLDVILATIRARMILTCNRIAFMQKLPSSWKKIMVFIFTEQLQS